LNVAVADLAKTDFAAADGCAADILAVLLCLNQFASRAVYALELRGLAARFRIFSEAERAGDEEGEVLGAQPGFPAGRRRRRGVPLVDAVRADMDGPRLDPAQGVGYTYTIGTGGSSGKLVGAF